MESSQGQVYIWPICLPNLRQKNKITKWKFLLRLSSKNLNWKFIKILRKSFHTVHCLILWQMSLINNYSFRRWHKKGKSFKAKKIASNFGQRKLCNWSDFVTIFNLHWYLKAIHLHFQLLRCVSLTPLYLSLCSLTALLYAFEQKRLTNQNKQLDALLTIDCDNWRWTSDHFSFSKKKYNKQS